MHDRDAMALWLSGFIAAEASGRADVGGLRFRRVSVLTGAGSEHIAELYGWIETDIDGEVLQLAMLQEFPSTAADGFELATGSVRAALVDPELTVMESGGDFGGEAARPSNRRSPPRRMPGRARTPMRVPRPS